jgi:hypothetical protein
MTKNGVIMAQQKKMNLRRVKNANFERRKTVQDYV